MNSATPPAHPGVILLEKAMKPLGVSRNKLARDIDVPVGRISDIVSGKRGISPDTALRLAKYFGTSAEMWMRLQWEYDLYVARVTVWPKIDPRVRVFEPVDDAGHPGVRARQVSEPILPDLPDPVLPGSDGSVMKPDVALPEAIDDEPAEPAADHEPAHAFADDDVEERELETAGVGFQRAAPSGAVRATAEPVGFALTEVAETAAVAVTAELLRESRDELHQMFRARPPVAAPEPQSDRSNAAPEPEAPTARYEPVEPAIVAVPEPDPDRDRFAAEHESSAGPPAAARMRYADPEPAPEPEFPEALADPQPAGSDEPAERVVPWPTHNDTNGFEPAGERETIPLDPPPSTREREPGPSRGDEWGAEAPQPTLDGDYGAPQIASAQAYDEPVPHELNGHPDPVVIATVPEEPAVPDGSGADDDDGDSVEGPLEIAAAESRNDRDGLAEQADAAFRGIDRAFEPPAPSLIGPGDAEPPLLDDLDDDEPLLLTEEMPSLDIPDPDDPRFRARRDGD